MKGIVFDIKRFAIHDGPGIRTTVFLKGCPLNCAWCHNPESQSPKQDILYRPGLCLMCGKCISACPRSALSRTTSAIERDSAACDLCGACAAICPSDALSRVGYSVESAELMEEIERDISFFDESSGGVTFSGGEPLAQPAFLAEMLDLCSRRRIHTAVDTSGHALPGVMADIAGRTDLVLFDIKLLDSQLHMKYTGVVNSNILDNLRHVSSRGIPMEIRTPIIPGITDTPENLDAIAAFIMSLPVPPPLRLLPHHRAAMSKYGRFGIPNRLPDIEDPTPDRIASIAAELRKSGIEVITS
jgi:pyruvate formate lyase activating enzyme